MIDALQEHAVVAIGESHDLAEAGRFYDRLVRSDAFAAAVDDVVVEFGNARYQATVDRYVAGKHVFPSDLRRVWQDTTQVGAWDAPMYAHFFSAVRAANADRPASRRIRVLLGDPPIEWSRVRSQDEVNRFLLRREPFMAHVIEREVLARGDRAVVIAGLAHLAHLERSATPSAHPDVTQILDERDPGAVYVVGVHLGFPKPEWEQAISTWRIPSIVALRMTWIGRLPKGDGRAQDALDAMLYLGGPDSLHLSVPLPNVYVRDGYWHTLKDRWPLGVGGTFSAKKLFSQYSNALYPGAFSQRSIEAAQRFAECMRKNRVQAFPDPQFQYDSVGFYGPALEEARQDPDLQAAQKVCLPLFPASP